MSVVSSEVNLRIISSFMKIVIRYRHPIIEELQSFLSIIEKVKHSLVWVIY